MSILEIVLVILGIAVFTASFLIPVKKEKDKTAETGLDEDKIKELIDEKVEESKNHLNDVLDETVQYTMEKTERSIERITNEKIMAINEYSDTVLGEINKNHKEVVFLYDMLNDKHENLINTVSEAVKTASEVKQTVLDAEITAKEAELKAKTVEVKVKKAAGKASEESTTTEDPLLQEFLPIHPEKLDAAGRPIEERMSEVKVQKARRVSKKDKAVQTQAAENEVLQSEVPEVTVRLNENGKAGGRNSNERILELHKAGKSNMAIAKELGLGIGEVKLVIDLFEGI